MRFGAAFAFAGALWIGAAAAACGETEDSSGCTAGESSTCTCEGGGTGQQLCGEDGLFGPCSCGTGGSGGSAGSGGTGGTGGVGGSGGVAGSGGTGGDGGTGGVGGDAGSGGTGGSGGEGGSGGTGGVGGEGGGAPPDPICSQVPDCEMRLDSSMDEICTLDGCVDVGPRDGQGQLLRGQIRVDGGFDPVTTTGTSLKSYELRLFHPVNANGTRLRCADIKAAPDHADPLFNVASRSVGGLNVQNSQSTAPTWAQNAPVTEEGDLFLAWVRFYGGSPDINGEPSGSVVLEGCTESVRVVAGGYVADEDHLYYVQMKR